MNAQPNLAEEREQCPYCTPQLPLCGAEMAYSEDRIYYCTRAMNHKGPHIACGAHHQVAKMSEVPGWVMSNE